jgi:GT2 family glycosyltransferase
MDGIACIVLTQGRRPQDLRLATESLLRQRGVEADVVVVGNAWQPTGLPAGVRGVALPAEAGVPGGRNAGVPHARGDLLFFLDDDASLRDDDALAHVEREFAADPQLGLLQLRVAPRGGGPPLRNWVPRLRVGDRARSSDVTAVWEGAVAIPRRVFEQVGGWPAEFGVVHEGIDLAWRVMDAGLRVRYAGDIVALHPSHAPGRHLHRTYFSARNRVWLARRHLPLPLAGLYVATFAVRTLPTLRSMHGAREVVRGLRDGARQPCGERRTLRPRTLWRMTRAGRPPVL